MNALEILKPSCMQCGADLTPLTENAPYGLCNECFLRRQAKEEFERNLNEMNQLPADEQTKL